jgi:hypothetical protein
VLTVGETVTATPDDNTVLPGVIIALPPLNTAVIVVDDPLAIRELPETKDAISGAATDDTVTVAEFLVDTVAFIVAVISTKYEPAIDALYVAEFAADIATPSLNH